MSIFAKIEKRYNLKLKAEPTRLHGGLIHKMYKLETEQGAYALKLLNKSVIQRETALENYAAAEELERLLEQNHIPILPALTFGGRKMQEIDHEYFYLFDHYDGKPLKDGDITEYHCAKMGKALAEIHSVHRKAGTEDFEKMSIDWRFYLSQMKKSDPRLYEMLAPHETLLVKSQDRGNRARKKLAHILTICHNDMDCKNVLWNGDDYRIIDLECLSYHNPFMELFESALCWSGYESCRIDFRLLRAFLQGYADSGGELPADWKTLYDCNNGRLEWLEYNMKRVLGIDCEEDEKEIGSIQVEKTIKQIVYYSKMKEQILTHCMR